MGVENDQKTPPKWGGRKHPKKGHFDPPPGGWRYTKQCKFWRDSSVLIQGVRRFFALRRVIFGSFFDPHKRTPRDGKPDVRPLKWVFPTPPFRRGVFDKVYSHPWVLAGRCPKLTSAQLLWCTPRLTQWVPVRMYITVHGLAHELEG